MHNTYTSNNLKRAIVGALSTLMLLSFTNTALAQNRPKWRGQLSSQASSFDGFIRRNIGKTVDLNLTFANAQFAKKYNSAGEPFTSLGGDTGPIFQVGGSVFALKMVATNETCAH